MFKDPMYVTIMVIVAVVAVLIIAGVECQKAEADRCAAQGGHKVYMYKSSLCVSADGRIIPL